MLLVTKRLLLAGIGVLGGAAIATAGPYSLDARQDCPDGHCPIGHAGHQCATGECETPGHHNHAGHNHAQNHAYASHDHAIHHHAGPCEEDCGHYGHAGAAEHRPYDNSLGMPPAGASRWDSSFARENRWNDPLPREPFSPTRDGRSVGRQDRSPGYFSGTGPANRYPSTWDDGRAFGNNPDDDMTRPLPRNRDYPPTTEPRMPRTLPVHHFNDRTGSRPMFDY